jgi:hypothetical protein
MSELSLLMPAAVMLIASLVICAGAGVVLMRAAPLELSWRALTGWALLVAAALLAAAAVRYATTGAAAPWEVALFALCMCVPVTRALWPRQQRLACLGMLDAPAPDLRLAGGMWGRQVQPHQARMPGRSRVFREHAP